MSDGALRTDVLVVGGGSSGCAAVHALLEAGVGSVVLVEAGPDYGPFGEHRWPDDLLSAQTVPRSHDWGYAGTYARGRVFPHERARVLGGCSAHNEANVVWAPPGVYDAWAAAFDDPTWSRAALQTVVDAVEDCTPASPAHGRGGRLPTHPYDEAELTQWSAAFLEAAAGWGLTRRPDFSMGDGEDGVSIWHANTRGTVRWNAAFAFVDPHRGDDRLRVLSHARVHRLDLAGSRVSAIGEVDGRPLRIEAADVVLAAGAVGTPEILLRSGIGPAREISRLGLTPVVDLPAVGVGLRDHIGVPLGYQLRPDAEAGFATELASSRVFHCQTIARLHAEGRDSFNLLPYEVSYDGQTWLHLLAAYVMNPRSSGSVRLRSADPGVPPIVDTGYLTDPADREQLYAGVDLLRSMVAAGGPYARLLASTEDSAPADRAGLASYVEERFIPYGHLMSSCRMGHAEDPAAAVTPDGRVKGTDHLYVADASAIPDAFPDATHLTALLVGYKVAAGLPHSRRP